MLHIVEFDKEIHRSVITEIVKSLLFGEALVCGELVDACNGISDQFLVHFLDNIHKG